MMQEVGSMWMVRKSEKSKKAKAEKVQIRECPWIGVVFYRLLLRYEEVKTMRLRRSMRTYNPLQQAGRWTCRPSYRSLAVPALALAPEEKGLLLEYFSSGS